MATIGLQQLPLSEVGGRVDRFIPYYDYDTVLAHALQNHTDILTARNGVVRAQYVLKLAQVTPTIPDLDVRATLEKDFALAPFGTYHALSVGFPIPIWDQNKGNIIAAQAALVRASEESHRVEVTLASNLASAYTNYKSNLVALEDYRRNILPDWSATTGASSRAARSTRAPPLATSSAPSRSCPRMSPPTSRSWATCGPPWSAWRISCRPTTCTNWRSLASCRNCPTSLNYHF